MKRDKNRKVEGTERRVTEEKNKRWHGRKERCGRRGGERDGRRRVKG